MKDREKLIMFVQLKDNIIWNIKKIKYINVEDIMDINSWDEDDCKNIYEDLTYTINNNNGSVNGLDAETCIWCIKNRMEGLSYTCRGCAYGKRYFKCGSF